MSGFAEIRLYTSTTNTIPVGFYVDIKAGLIGTASSTIVPNVSYDYDNGNKVVGGLSPGTTYWIWLELIDAAGNSGGILPLGNHTTAAATQVDDVWLFYSAGSTFGTQCINRFYYNGAAGEGGTYAFSYDHVTLYDINEAKGILPENGDGSVTDTAVPQQGSGTALTMNPSLKLGYSQLAWPTSGVTAADPKLAFSIKIPGNHSTKVPAAGWSWNQGAVNGSQLGSWIIFRNGVQVNHTGTNNPSGTGQAYRDIEPI